jgi:RimJ/RimL family protein N-acetyltransferase
MTSLVPFNSVVDRQARMQAWTSDPYNHDFFRNMPPFFTWNSEAMMDQLYSTSYFFREDETVKGLIVLSQLDVQNKNVHFGILADKGTRLKIICDASRQVQDYLFHHLGLEKMYCRIMRDRQDLPKVLGLNGFKCEGILRNSVWVGGKFQDEALYGLLKEEFIACQEM